MAPLERDGSGADQPGLTWAIVDGVPRHVSMFAHLPPRRRPTAYCPQCARRLTLKLGAVRRHHAAHDAGHVCAATRPETALHLNTKFALAAALRETAGPGAMLSTIHRCADACPETLVGEWLRDWDEVIVEHRVGDARRPDIVLRQRGTILGAVEVVVTHAVSAEKAEALANLDVPWVEVRADEHIAVPGGWTTGVPLAVIRASDAREWRCDSHRAIHAAALGAAEAKRAEERDAARNSSVLLAARVVDVYHAGGVRERFIYRVSERLTDGQAHTMRLQRGGAEIVEVAMAADVDRRRNAWPLIRAAFDADVEHFARGEDSFVDSPMRWARSDAAENIVEEALTDRVGRDPTPLATRFPRRWFYAKEQQRWFVPAEMRDVRWDRPTHDAFAAHPAWSRAHASVRENPAPGGSWSTPVFASRPLAAMFRASVRSIAPGAADGSMMVLELIQPSTSPRRSIVVIERPTTDEAIVSLIESLATDRVDAAWISHPRDWTESLAAVPWAPAGRDSRGRGGVVVDEVGVFRADQFARAVAKNDRRLSAAALRRHSAARLERLRSG